MIDSHVHFWNFDPIRDSWISENMAIIRNDFTPQDFLLARGELPVTGCIAVQADQTEAQNHYLLALAKESDVIKGIVGWVDLLHPELENRLVYWKDHKLIKGFRHILQAETNEFITNDLLAHGISQLHNFNYTYDLLCYHTQLEAINSLFDQLPKQPLVLDHCGKPEVGTQDLKAYDKNIEQLARNGNVFCKLSGLLTEANWKNWKELEIFNCFDIIFKHFGTERIMFGSDWPVMLLSRPYEEWFKLVNKYLAQFSEADRLMIYTGNATKFYKL